MSDDNDPSILRFFQSGVHGFDINRNNADGINALCDQVLYLLCLGNGIDRAGIYLVAVHTGIGCELINTGLHTDEPGVGGILRHNCNFPALVSGFLDGLAVRRCCISGNGKACRHHCAHQNRKHFLVHWKPPFEYLKRFNHHFYTMFRA